MNTCSQCKLFRQFYGEKKGECFALPPPASHSQSPPPPHVNLARPACTFFKPLAEGEAAMTREKKDPDRPSEATTEKMTVIQANQKAYYQKKKGAA